MKVVVLCPHFAPDTAPTGTVMTGIVAGLTARGHEVHVVTSLPWYRTHKIESGWSGRLIRREITEWGSITRVHPFPGGDKANLLRRALGFIGFTALAGLAALRPGGWFRKVDAVLSMSPPLTLGLTGWLVAKIRRGRFVFNIQDVFPDAAVKTGAITNPLIIRVASILERVSYRRSDVVTVLSDDLAENVNAKLSARAKSSTSVEVIPNFVDTELLAPADGTPYREELGLGIGPVVMYAGNLGFSQSIDLVIGLAEQRPHISVVINGDGAMQDAARRAAERLNNLHYVGYQPAERLAEVLSAADIHLVPLRAGLGSVSVPSKTYSILAVGRPVIAAIDNDSAISRLLADANAGVSVPPDDVDALVGAVDRLVENEAERRKLGENGRRWVVEHASPVSAAAAYERVLSGLHTG